MNFSIASEAMGILVSIRFCDAIIRWVQPPDKEKRMSGDVAELAGAILPPLPVVG